MVTKNNIVNVWKYRHLKFVDFVYLCITHGKVIITFLIIIFAFFGIYFKNEEIMAKISVFGLVFVEFFFICRIYFTLLYMRLSRPLNISTREFYMQTIHTLVLYFIVVSRVFSGFFYFWEE